MRLSSSFNGKLKGEFAALALAIEYFDKLGLLACGVLCRGVRACLVGTKAVDFEDLGVGVSILSNPKCCCLWLLDGGLGLAFISERGLGGVS
jgi:hypothetical protein